MTARHAVQTAEDARAIAVKRQDDDLLAAERQAGADRQASAESGRAAAESETSRVTREAAEARLRSEDEAARVKRDNDAQSADARAEADRLRRDNDAQRRGLLIEADRLKRDNDAQRASALSEADRLKQESDAKLAAAQTDLDRAALRPRAGGSGQGRAARQAPAAVQRDSADSRHRPWIDREFIGCPLRRTAKFSLRLEAREETR